MHIYQRCTKIIPNNLFFKLKRNIFLIVSLLLLTNTNISAFVKPNHSCYDLLFYFVMTDSTSAYPTLADTVFVDSSQNLRDTINFFSGTVDTVFQNDTLLVDTIKTDTSESDLESKVEYAARDSIRFDIPEKKVYLYGEAEIKYEAMNLKAEYIIIDWNINTIFAEGGLDSNGKAIGRPFFIDEDQQYNCDKMMYNFDTKKGKIFNVLTKEGEGFIHGELVKKNETDEFFVKNGKYTTCDHPEEPHFHIAMSKLKVIPNDKIVTGPAYLVVENVPTPLAIPFGIFPNNKGQASGILMPFYGESNELGFYLRNGGYYWGISDYIDMSFKGDIYSKSSWGANIASNYKKKYKYNGSLSLSYSLINRGEKGSTSFNQAKDFFIRWNHDQDRKARPHSNFRASVNAGSSTYLQNTSYDVEDYLTSQLQSSVSYTWQKKLYNFSANIRHSQNTKTRLVNLSLPELAFSVNRIYPLKKKITVGTKKWYETIGLNYSVNAKNDIKFIDTTLFIKTYTEGGVPSQTKEFNSDLISEFRNGLKHSVPISMSSIKFMKHINISPSANYNERWYFKTIDRYWDQDSLVMRTDTVTGFKRAVDFSGSVNASTALYGMYNFKGKKIIAIRHVVRPNLSFSYNPDFGSNTFGYYKEVQLDTLGNMHRYSIFENGIYGSPSDGKSGTVGLSIGNNLEMKIKTKRDTINPIKKIKLIENFIIGTAYNLAADSLNLSNLFFDANTRLFEKINLRFNAIIDPYIHDSNGTRINQFELKENKRIGKLDNMSVYIGTSFNSKPPQSKKDKKFSNVSHNNYADFIIPWQLTTNYSLNFINDYLNDTLIITQSFNLSGNIKLTHKWEIGFISGYDFRNKDLTYTSVNITRNLHCWEMKFNWIPFGYRQSYEFSLNVKSSVLQDLKIHRRRDWFDNE